MAYLPPAGVRLMTDNKRSNLILWKEVPNRFFVQKEPLYVMNAPLRCLQYPRVPLNERDWDSMWEVPRRPRLESYTCKNSNMVIQQKRKAAGCNDFEYGSHSTDDCNWTLYEAAADDFPKIPEESMFLGKPDNKKRADWISRWQEDYLRFSGSLGHWQRMYGRKYHYNEMKSTRSSGGADFFKNVNNMAKSVRL